jgi:transaldolase
MDLGGDYLSIRKQLFFDTDVSEFEERCASLTGRFEGEYRKAGSSGKAAHLANLSELILDLASYLPRWRLASPERTAKIDDDALRRIEDELFRFARRYDSSGKCANMQSEIESQKRSNFRKMSDLSDRGILNTRWGNDSAVGLSSAMRRGAVVATINPVMINAVRKSDPRHWGIVKARVRQQHPEQSPVELASRMTMEVGLSNCRQLRPIYDATEGKYGCVCLQINPQNASEPDKMINEAASLYRDLAAELGGTPNVAFKIPGTKAGLEAVGEITSRGIPVTVTASASISQHLAFAQVIENGKAPVSYLTMMNGRLDDPVGEELLELGVPQALEASRWASTAVMRKSYRMLYRDGDFRRSILLAASMRGPWNVEGSTTDGKREIIITVFPDRALEYDSEEREISSHINEAVPEDIMKTLEKSAIFLGAYHPERVDTDGFDAFYPVAASLRQFTANYEEFLQYVST